MTAPFCYRHGEYHVCSPDPPPVSEQPSLFMSAAEMNATYSPTGRVMDHMPDTSVKAAFKFKKGSHHAVIMEVLTLEGRHGTTSREVAKLLPLDREGERQNSNRANTRLGELWEQGKATVLRQNGVCVLGRCHPHVKPAVIHRPQDECVIHGKPIVRNQCAIWVAT